MESQFGKFRLTRYLGGGRLSQVFRVRSILSTAEELPVALKRVHPEMIGDPAFVRLVVREAGVLTRLTHPNLCRCLELGVIDGSAFLTLDLVHGCTLRALMRRLAQLGAKLPASSILSIAYELSGVLDYLHRGCKNPVVHLDMSPQNVMISTDGRVKLIDFGLAQYIDGHNPPPTGDRIAGTVGYMSPEQAQGAPTSRAADQYSLGILLWELLCGRRLFRGNTTETWERMRHGRVPARRQAMRKVPEELSAVVYRMLQPRPDRRFGHMGKVGRALAATTERPRSGARPLAALVRRLLSDPTFDPFDRVRRPTMTAPESTPDIPTGESGTAEYEALSIEVDHGQGSPASQVRAVLPDRLAPPQSPFLETLPETGRRASSGSR